jgi:methylase of polypeptide subunit release factors
MNLKPSPDIVATRYVDVLRKIKEVWFIEVKGVNEALVRVDQLEVLVNLARFVSNPPYLRAVPVVAVVGEGVISFHDGEALLKKALLLQKYDDIKKTTKGRLVAAIDANRVSPFLELPEVKQPCKKVKSTFEYLRDAAVRELEEMIEGDIRLILGDKVEVIPRVKAYEPTEDKCVLRLDEGGGEWG